MFDNEEFEFITKDGPFLALCEIKYPFRIPYLFGVVVDNQVHTFEQIWGQMIYMYSTIKSTDHKEGIYNAFIESDRFGSAFHIIDDLVPSVMNYNINENYIDFWCDS